MLRRVRTPYFSIGHIRLIQSNHIDHFAQVVQVERVAYRGFGATGDEGLPHFSPLLSRRFGCPPEIGMSDSFGVNPELPGVDELHGLVAIRRRV